MSDSQSYRERGMVLSCEKDEAKTSVFRWFGYITMKIFYFCILSLLCLSFSGFADDSTVIPEVSVNAPSLASQEDDLLLGQKNTINQTAIDNNPSTSLAELLKSQSIVRVANNSGDNSQSILSVRGFGDNAQANSLILVDGFPLINSSLLAPNFNAILLSDIKKINLFQGSQGSLWGNQAVGGVMDVETHHPEQAFGDINVAYGSYDKQFLSGIYGARLSNGFFYKILGFTNNNDNYRYHNQQTNNGLSVEEGLDYASGSLSFDQKFYEDTIAFPGSLTQEQYEQDPRQASDTSDYVHYKTQIYQALNKQTLTDNWLLETRASSNNTHSYGFMFSPFHSYEWLNFINPQLIGHLNKNKLTLGYSGEASNYESFNSQVQSRAHSTQNDLYTQIVIPFLTHWDLTLGARSAWQKNTPEIVLGEPIHYTDHIFVTEQGLVYHLSHALSLFLRRDGNFRFPKTNEEVWLPTNVTELKPQAGVSYETGLTWKNQQQKLQLNLYQLRLNNEIAYDPTQTSTQPFGATSNLDPTLRRGVTLSEELQLTKKLALNAQANYVHARFSSGPYSGNFIPAVPAWNGNLSLTYKITEHWQTNYNELYLGSAYPSDDVTNTGTNAPAYWIGQWSLQYFFKSMKVNFEVNNLFNQRYSVFTIYDVNTQTNSYYPGAGRSYTLSFKTSL